MNVVQKLKIKNKCDCYSKEENIVRLSIMNFTIKEGRAFNINRDFSLLNTGLSSDKIKSAMKNLARCNGFMADEDGDINFVYPVSALETNHKVTLADGSKFFAMCAIDALGTAFTFNQDTVINSVCSNSNKHIRVEIRNGKLYSFDPPTLHALHVDLNKFTNWVASC